MILTATPRRASAASASAPRRPGLGPVEEGDEADQRQLVLVGAAPVAAQPRVRFLLRQAVAART
ncbi:MAG: hypothetical protein WC809_19200 [Sinimarinibacterium sp.]|jgi:hypothetical protein